MIYSNHVHIAFIFRKTINLENSPRWGVANPGWLKQYLYNSPWGKSRCTTNRYAFFTKIRYNKLIDKYKQHISTFQLWNCHCAECETDCHLNSGQTALQSNPILRSTVPKTMFWTVLQTWDCFPNRKLSGHITKQIDSANHFVLLYHHRGTINRLKALYILI